MKPPHVVFDGSQFGHAVSLSSDGRVIAVGMPGDGLDDYGVGGVISIHSPPVGGQTHSASGSVVMFRRGAFVSPFGSGDGYWTPAAYMREPVGGGPGRRFGSAVGVDGVWPAYDVIASAPSGDTVHVYHMDVSTGSVSGSVTRSGAVGSSFGKSVGLSSDGAGRRAFVVGAPLATPTSMCGSGHVYFYVWDGASDYAAPTIIEPTCTMGMTRALLGHSARIRWTGSGYAVVGGAPGSYTVTGNKHGWGVVRRFEPGMDASTERFALAHDVRGEFGLAVDAAVVPAVGMTPKHVRSFFCTRGGNKRGGVNPPEYEEGDESGTLIGHEEWS